MYLDLAHICLNKSYKNTYKHLTVLKNFPKKQNKINTNSSFTSVTFQFYNLQTRPVT